MSDQQPHDGGRRDRNGGGGGGPRDGGPRDGGGGGGGNAGHRLFVGNLSWGTDDQSLRVAFEKDHNVSDAKVIFDHVTGRSRGFGFVTFETQEDAENAMASMHDFELDGRNIRVDKATSQRR